MGVGRARIGERRRQREQLVDCRRERAGRSNHRQSIRDRDLLRRRRCCPVVVGHRQRHCHRGVVDTRQHRRHHTRIVENRTRRHRPRVPDDRTVEVRRTGTVQTDRRTLHHRRATRDNRHRIVIDVVDRDRERGCVGPAPPVSDRVGEAVGTVEVRIRGEFDAAVSEDRRRAVRWGRDRRHRQDITVRIGVVGEYRYVDHRVLVGDDGVIDSVRRRVAERDECRVTALPQIIVRDTHLHRVHA